MWFGTVTHLNDKLEPSDVFYQDFGSLVGWYIKGEEKEEKEEQGNSLAVVDFPGGSDGKASAYNEGDPVSIPGSGRFPGEGNGNPLQYSCLENPMDGGAW